MPSLTDEQIKAIESIDKHVLVSAGAGSGKTFVLVERYINVLKTYSDASINDIIAVTYTTKAAEEMRSRLKARLSTLAADSQGAEQLRWTECLAELESARIGTIHSLCDSILKNYPAEAGIDPGFEILDDLERAELLTKSIDDSLHMIIASPVDGFAELLDYPIENLKGWLQEFLSSPLKYKEARRCFGDGTRDSIRRFAEELISHDIDRSIRELVGNKVFISEFAYLKDSPWNDSESRLGILQTEMLAYLATISDLDAGRETRWQAIVALAHMDSARNAGGPVAKELRECMRLLRHLAINLAKKHKVQLNEADEKSFTLLQALIDLADHALSSYERIKQLHQKLDFDDLIERCQQLVCNSENTYALRQLCKNLKAILVDEFQDTNWTQAKLLSALAQKSACLFLIGDDKQSIYKFQGADVGTFNAFKTYIASMQEADQLPNGRSAGGSPASNSVPTLRQQAAKAFGLPILKSTGCEMTLSMSFRSHPQIVNFVNHLFAILLDKPRHADPKTVDQDSYKSQFHPLRPARSGEDQLNRIDIIYSPQLEEGERDPRQELDKLEAEQTALWIKQKVQQGAEVFDKELGSNRKITYADFAILIQANSDIADFESALAKEEIPFVSIGGSGFLKRQEVFDLENLLKWLHCPQDSHALFAVLRSPIIGFSDDILHDLKAGKPTSLWQALLQKSQETGQEELRAARRILQDLQRQAGKLILPEILRKAVLITGYDIVLLSSPSGKQKSRNVWNFVAMANQHKHMSVAEFLSAINSMRELGVKNLTDAPLCADDAVKIMTIHRSKGLEFAAVAIPRLARSVFSQPKKLLFGKDLSVAFDCTRDREEEKPAFFTAASNLNRRMDEEERKRLLYVGLTRARDYLGLFITSRCKSGTNFGKYFIESLHLPEADCEAEEQLMQVGHGENSCTWQIIQATRKDRNESADSNHYHDAKDSATGVPLITIDYANTVDYSLLEEDSLQEQQFTPVAWQSLLRTCPADETPTVHPTIMGNYFHLLMGKLGPELELPSDAERSALLLSHEVAVHDEAQQELMLRESERLLLAFKNSDLHPLMKKAKRILFEQAYIILRDGKPQEFRPDLLIEDENGQWHVVDFKTDHFDMKQLKKQLKTHQAQLATYVDDLATLLSIQAKPWLYFAQHGRLEALDLTAPFQLSLFPL